MQHPDAVDIIEALGRERQIENIGLEKCCGTVRQVACRYFGGQTKIDADHVRTPARGHVSKPSHPTANIEHELACEVLGGKAGSAPKSNFGAVALAGIQLRARKHLPLETKTTGIMLCVDEARNFLHERKDASATLTCQDIGPLTQAGFAGKATQKR